MNSKSESTRVNSGEQAVDKFATMMIERMKAIKASDWKQGWTNGRGAFYGMPQNMSGRNYSGTNSFFLQMDTAMNGYHAPVYLTFLQAMKENVRIKKGAEAMPVIYWDLNVKDKDGHRMSVQDYRSLSAEKQKECAVHPFLRAFKVFNIDQTNLEEIKKEKYDALLSRFQGPQLRDGRGMYENPALDRMIERQEWICRIQNDRIVDGAFYSPSRDLVVVPKKAQFNISNTEEGIYKDGMEYYSSLLHEMTHSTGTANRLNREKGARFGDAKYAKEELVAELTAAMVGNSMGFDKRILNNNAAYIDGWINALRQEPQFIVSVMADVNKASKMIIEKVDDQRIALGQRPLLSKNNSEKNEQEVKISAKRAAPLEKQPISLNVKFDNIEIKKDNGYYRVNAVFDGRDLGFKPVTMVEGKRIEMMQDSALKDNVLHDLAAKKFVKEVNAVREIKSNNTEGVSASITKRNNGEYFVQATVEGQRLEPKPIERKTGYNYMRMNAGLEKKAVLSGIVRNAYGDELKAVPKHERQQSQGLKL